MKNRNGIFQYISVIIIFAILVTQYSVQCGYFSIKMNRKHKNRMQEGTSDLFLLESYQQEENNLFHKYFAEGITNENILENPLERGDLVKLAALVQENLQQKNQSNSFFSSEQITNYFNIQYYGNIYIGSSEQEMSVIFDTGSNFLWVSSMNCTNCRNFTKRYDYTKSSTFINLNTSKNITYAIGFVNGSYVQDSVYINTRPSNDPGRIAMGVDKIKFLLIDSEKYLDGTIADGVLGLGLDFEGDRQTSFVDLLYSENKIKSPQFSFYLTDSKYDSRLYLGDISENAYIKHIISQMKYCEVNTTARYWECGLQSITVNGKSNVNTPNKNLGNFTTILSDSKVIFDTGTSFIIIPGFDFLTVIPFFIAQSPTGKCGLTPYFQLICQCNSPNDFGVVDLNIGGSNFTLHMEKLIEFYPTLQYQCRFEIIVDILFMDMWILGDSALRSNLITFNMDTRTIGWSQNREKLDDRAFASGMVQSKETVSGGILLWVGIVFVILALSGLIVYLSLRGGSSGAQVGDRR